MQKQIKPHAFIGDVDDLVQGLIIKKQAQIKLDTEANKAMKQLIDRQNQELKMQQKSINLNELYKKQPVTP